MLAFGLTIFTSAFLLFMVQPLIARFILPWFGGSPAVWTTCMLFFQVLLLGGYAYAHLIIRKLTPRRQVVVHLGLLGLALLLLPITPAEHWKPLGDTAPMARILVLLLVSLGLPYLVLSATGPLMQAWFSQARPGVAPYRLYALSNIGSLLALVSYPFLVEPSLPRHAQAIGWSWGLGVFALPAVWCGVIVWRSAGARLRGGAEPASSDASPVPAAPAVAKGAGWFWFLLPACASVLLLAVTNKICQDIAVIPFLWVLPLGLYLLSFIVSFDNPRWYARWFWIPVLGLAGAAVVILMVAGTMDVGEEATSWPWRWVPDPSEDVSLLGHIGVHLAMLFAACMVCHGELYRLRPEPRKLTGYYLMIAAGGAFGGFLVAIVAPLIFDDYFELHAGLVWVALLACAVLLVDKRSPLRRLRGAWAWVLVLSAFAGLGAGIYQDYRWSRIAVVERARNFYGVLVVEEFFKGDPEHEIRLTHGGTTHGLQMRSEDLRMQPTTYYTSTSGIGLTFEYFPRKSSRRVGVCGLGTGTILAWGKPGDSFRIYEINHDVTRLARSRFSYLGETPAQVEVVMGDARLSMERETDQGFDILILDAFSSDAIPVHLLTREAFETYRRHLRPDGVIAVHISNRHLELEPVVRRAVEHFGFGVAVVNDPDSDWGDWFEEEESETEIRHYGSDWVLLTNNREFLNLRVIHDAVSSPREGTEEIGMWTDEQSNLFEVLMLENDSWLAWLRRLVL